jgi:hypothetical protein
MQVNTIVFCHHPGRVLSPLAPANPPLQALLVCRSSTVTTHVAEPLKLLVLSTELRLDLLPSGPHASQVGSPCGCRQESKRLAALRACRGRQGESVASPRSERSFRGEGRRYNNSRWSVRHADHPASRANLALFPPFSASTQAIFLRQGSPLNCSKEAQGKASAGHRHLVLCNIPALTCLSDTSQTHPSVVARHLFLVFRAAAARAQQKKEEEHFAELSQLTGTFFFFFFSFGK